MKTVSLVATVGVDGWRALSSVTVLLEAQCPLASAGGSNVRPLRR